RFTNPLELPPLLEGRLEAGIQVYDLNLQRGHRNFFSDLATPTAGINGSFLGPVVRVNRGDRIRLNVTNRLSESSTLHWHGMHLPAKMDGGPHQVIEPGATWSPEFDVRQPASTQWYHSHMLHRTGIQVYYGLAGLLYIDDEVSSSLGLPSEYGVDDIPLVLQDRSFNRDGTFSYLDSMHDRMVGMTGSVMLVNGVAGALLKAQRRRLRLRILNGSNARIYNLEFSDQREFQQIATDGGLLSRPVALRSVRLAPGERAEIVAELSPGDDLMLRHTPPSSRRSEGSGMMGMMGGMMRTDTQPFSILRINGSEVTPAAGIVPQKLVEPRNWSEDKAAKTRRFVLDMGMGMGMMGSGGG
ncbi:MAG TPA: multicopper oxidase domain-containing protein, partial [Gammaproteobacteria bacterium]|nr:multicopper oxidase domain-containing protein [Gammaproteobacteria bacterium]